MAEMTKARNKVKILLKRRHDMVFINERMAERYEE